jgi:hypothetical protein
MFLSFEVFKSFKTFSYEKYFLQSIDKILILRQKFMQDGFSIQETQMQIYGFRETHSGLTDSKIEVLERFMKFVLLQMRDRSQIWYNAGHLR